MHQHSNIYKATKCEQIFLNDNEAHITFYPIKIHYAQSCHKGMKQIALNRNLNRFYDVLFNFFASTVNGV